MLLSEAYIGARVRALNNHCYAITNYGWKGIILSTRNERASIKVAEDEYSAGYWVDPQYFELLSEPKPEEPEPKPFVITDEEYEYILKNVKNLLDEYDYRYTEDALDKIINTWATNKADLITAFKKHPNYIEGKFMIAFQSDIERTADKRKCENFSNWLRGFDAMEFIRNIVPEEVKSKRENPNQVFPWNIYDFLNEDLRNLTDQFIDEDTAGKLNRILPEVHAHTGQKTSRVINKLCCYLGYDKCPDYNKEFAKYADGLNPLVIKRHTVLSINPLDYLTMSFGNSWASCHTIDKRNKRNMPNDYSGCYSSGTISYMLDETSMVFYTVDASYNGTEYWNQPKINRQMFHWGEEKLIQGRLYPQDNDGDYAAYKPYRNIVQEIISTICDFPNLWDVKRGTVGASHYIFSEGTHYKDYECYGNCNISRVRGSENEEYITVGHDPICIECGYTHSVESCINCCHKVGTICADCGCVIEYEDDEIWIDGEVYCRDCVSYCDSCDEYTREEVTWVESENRYVCDSCLREYYTCCDECDEWYDRDETTWIESEEIGVCSDCLHEHFTECAECGEWFRNTNIMEYEPTGEELCHDCYEERTEDDEAV